MKTDTTIVKTRAFAKQVAKFSENDRKKYTLAPKAAAAIIKRKLLNDKTVVSNYDLVTIQTIADTQPKEYKKLGRALLSSLNNDNNQGTSLQEVRAKLYHYDLCVFTNAYEKLEKMQTQMDIYKTYSSDDMLTGWCFCWLLEFIVGGIMAAIAINAC